MIELKLTLDSMKRKMTGEEILLIHRDDQRLIEIGSLASDELGLDPPILVDRGGMEIVIERLKTEGKNVMIMIWKADREEFGSDPDLEQISDIPFDDDGSIFKGPTLSLISRTGPFWNNIPERSRAVYDKRYRKISEGYFEGLRRGGLEISSIAVSGDMGEYFRNGMADIAIGMINGEDSLMGTLAWPLDRIYPSVAIIAKIR